CIMIKRLLLLFSLFIIILQIPALAFSKESVVNVYGWSAEMPDSVIRQFEKETSIKVNFSTFESNEIMFAKLRAMKKPSYDVVFPSSYVVDRMNRLGMLETIDAAQLSHWNNIDPSFLHPAYDTESKISIPFLWGVTG